jgi:acetyl-CoA carboxylase biotin carboxyl carrier protein
MNVVAEVAGKVWKIEARPGAQLAAEDTILILESMKMEIPVVAPRAGRLAELRVKEGDTVKEGDAVAVMETWENGDVAAPHC